MKTFPTASAAVTAVPGQAALADETCNLPTADMHCWKALAQLADDFKRTIVATTSDDARHGLKVTVLDRSFPKMAAVPATPDAIDCEVRRRRTTKPEKST